MVKIISAQNYVTKLALQKNWFDICTFFVHRIRNVFTKFGQGRINKKYQREVHGQQKLYIQVTNSLFFSLLYHIYGHLNDKNHSFKLFADRGG